MSKTHSLREDYFRFWKNYCELSRMSRLVFGVEIGNIHWYRKNTAYKELVKASLIYNPYSKCRSKHKIFSRRLIRHRNKYHLLKVLKSDTLDNYSPNKNILPKGCWDCW